MKSIINLKFSVKCAIVVILLFSLIIPLLFVNTNHADISPIIVMSGVVSEFDFNGFSGVTIEPEKIKTTDENLKKIDWSNLALSPWQNFKNETFNTTFTQIANDIFGEYSYDSNFQFLIQSDITDNYYIGFCGTVIKSVPWAGQRFEYLEYYCHNCYFIDDASGISYVDNCIAAGTHNLISTNRNGTMAALGFALSHEGFSGVTDTQLMKMFNLEANAWDNVFDLRWNENFHTSEANRLHMASELIYLGEFDIIYGNEGPRGSFEHRWIKWFEHDGYWFSLYNNMPGQDMFENIFESMTKQHNDGKQTKLSRFDIGYNNANPDKSIIEIQYDGYIPYHKVSITWDDSVGITITDPDTGLSSNNGIFEFYVGSDTVYTNGNDGFTKSLNISNITCNFDLEFLDDIPYVRENTIEGALLASKGYVQDIFYGHAEFLGFEGTVEFTAIINTPPDNLGNPPASSSPQHAEPDNVPNSSESNTSTNVPSGIYEPPPIGEIEPVQPTQTIDEVEPAQPTKQTSQPPIEPQDVNPQTGIGLNIVSISAVTASAIFLISSPKLTKKRRTKDTKK